MPSKTRLGAGIAEMLLGTHVGTAEDFEMETRAMRESVEPGAERLERECVILY